MFLFIKQHSFIYLLFFSLMALRAGERETIISPLAFPQKLKCTQSYAIPWRSFKEHHYPKRGFFEPIQSCEDGKWGEEKEYDYL